MSGNDEGRVAFLGSPPFFMFVGKPGSFPKPSA